MINRLIVLSLLFVNMLTAANINSKDIFTPVEQILVNFTDMTAKQDDWVGIYPENSNNDWGNVIAWKWTGDVTDGDLTFNPLAVGSYEVRAFYNNSFTLEASKKFSVEAGAGEAVTVTTNKATYTQGEDVVITYTNMSGNPKDWIGIYPAGSTHEWKNNIRAKWTNGQVAGTQTFETLPVGNYEVRMFFNNTYNLEASHAFSVTAADVAATVTTNKETYAPNEAVTASFNDMLGDAQDWIGIYPAGSTNAWGNVVQWKWTNGENAGAQIFNGLAIGDYDVRVFFNNSFKLEASHTFSIKDTGFDLTNRKETYDPFELIHADFKGMRGAASDWIGIFPVGANHSKGSAIEWRYVKSLVEGELSFNGLPAGDYEMRAYFATLHKKTINFTVRDIEAVTTLYDDAENGLDPRWVNYDKQRPVQLINVGANGSAHSVRTTFPSGYYFLFGETEKKMKFLELDMRIGNSSHNLNFGVKVNTTKGTRRIIFATYMNHPGNQFGTPPEGWDKPYLSSEGYQHNHPGPTDYYLATNNGTFIHYKINIEKKLRILEPDIELLNIISFTTAGGDYDNLSLVSQ